MCSLVLSCMLHSSSYSATHSLQVTLNSEHVNRRYTFGVLRHQPQRDSSCSLPTPRCQPYLFHYLVASSAPLRSPIPSLFATSELHKLELFRLISANMFCPIFNPVISHIHFCSVQCLTLTDTEKKIPNFPVLPLVSLDTPSSFNYLPAIHDNFLVP